MTDDLYLLAINLTRRCNLNCAHCYLDAETLSHGDPDELTTAEVCTLLDQTTECGSGAMVVLTGGEPLLRKDVEAIVQHGTDRGLCMVVGSNGTTLTQRRVESLKAAGLAGVGISLDSLQAGVHDHFRGQKGCWDKTIKGIELCRQHELPFQIHFSINHDNVDELDDIVGFSREVGARVLNIFFLVCTGRGESMTDISPVQYERTLERIIAAQQAQPDLIIRARCAPHFKRIAFQQQPDSALNRLSGNEGDGCIAASHYCRVTPTGEVTACPYMDDSCGNGRQQSLQQIWRNAPGLQMLREPQLKGKCGDCEFRRLCGGCRARARAVAGDALAADPWCEYQPSGNDTIEELPESDPLQWQREAEERLTRAPGFLQRLIRRRAEAFVRELGDDQVTCAHLDTLMARRFGDTPPGNFKANLTDNNHRG